MPPGTTVEVQFTGDADGVTHAVRELVNGIRQIGQAERAVQQEAGRTSSEIVSGMLKGSLAVGAAYKAYDLLRGVMHAAIGAGMEFNQAQETGALGIATLITAQADLVDSHGRVLKGQEALTAAQRIGEEQMARLRVQGLQTAATTRQLTSAFQTAEGAGLAAGLTLDQLREVTVSTVQAAGALGVPMEQLDQEVRALLSGDIDANARVARALGITNAQIKQAKEQGKLYEFLSQRMVAFNVAGAEVAKTYEGVTSNVKEVFEVAAGAATKPLFDGLKQGLTGVLDAVLDSQQGTIRPEFQNIIDSAADASRILSDLLVGALREAVEGAKELGKWLKEHREEVHATYVAVVDVVSEVGGLLLDLGRIVAETIRWGIETGIIQETFRTVADLVGVIRDAMPLIIAGATIRAGALAVANPWTAAAVAVGALVVGLHHLATAEERAREAAQERFSADADALSQAQDYADEARRLERVIADQKSTTDQVTEAQRKLEELQQKVIDLGPEYRQAVEMATARHDSLAGAIDNENRSRRENLNLQYKQAEIAARQAEGEFQAYRTAHPEADPVLRFRRDAPATPAWGQIDAQGIVRRMEQLQQAARVARQTADALEADLAKAEHHVAATTDNATVRSRPPAPDANAGKSAAREALQRLKEAVSAQMEAIKAELAAQDEGLKQEFADHAISIAEYFDSLLEARRTATQHLIDQQQRLLDATRDPSEREKIAGDIAQLQRDLAAQEADIGRQRVEQERKFQDQLAQVRAQAAEVQGNTAEAAGIRIEAEFHDLLQFFRAQMNEAGRLGEQFILLIINKRRAKAQLDELLQMLGRAETTLQNRLNEINTLRESGLISQRTAQHNIAEAYRRERHEVELLIPRLQALAETTHDPVAIQALDEWRVKLEQIDLAIRQAEDAWFRLRNQSLDATKEALADFLSSGIDQVHGLADAMRSLLESIAQGVRRILAEMTAEVLTDQLRGLLRGGGKGAGSLASDAGRIAVAGGALTAGGHAVGVGADKMLAAAFATTAAAMAMTAAANAVAAGAGAGAGAGAAGGGIAAGIASAVGAAAGALAGVPHFAKGGLVTSSTMASYAVGGLVSGPGTATSDSVAAWLSDGEYVVPAGTVEKMGGPGFFRDLDLLQHDWIARPQLVDLAMYRRPQVPDAPAARPGPAGEALHSEIFVGLEEGLVARHIKSPAGREALVNLVQKNRRAFRTALGLPY